MPFQAIAIANSRPTVAFLEMLGRFVEHKAGGKLLTAVRAKNWAKIAYFYNGPGYQQNCYDEKMENAYKKLKNIA